MTQQRPDGPRRPTPEQLAACADDEFDTDARRQVEDWLAAHPEDRAEVEGQRGLTRLYHDTAPPEPGEEAWAVVLARVANATTRTRPQPRRSSRRLAGIIWLAGALAATAAALLVTVLLSRPGPGERYPLIRGPFPFMTDDDVEIISMDAGDVPALVVGEPPRKGVLVMASADDVTVHESGEDVEVHMPDAKDQGSPAWPLVLVPADPGKEP